MSIFFLPENKKPSKVDVLLITGDAYIDHPSFGIAIIARILEDKRYTVCVVSQPPYYESDFINQLPQPRLFIGITAGNLDSTVSNYTSQRNRRKQDVYSIDGDPRFANKKLKRPDRATIFYTSYIKQRFKNIPIVLGGMEASLRRFTHYDYIQHKIRRSILMDSKADLLVYSMGEKAVLEIAHRCQTGKTLQGIPGTCIKVNGTNHFDNAEWLPSYEDILKDPFMLLKATQAIESNMVPDLSAHLLQDQGNGVLLQYSPWKYETEDLDSIYRLPFKRDYPDYCQRVPAWQMIKNSITSHRGCFGRCSFCSIASNQGPIIVSRSVDSILEEIQTLMPKRFFKGTISDIGGPSANMYGLNCKIGWCQNPSCLYPSLCENLIINEAYLNVLKRVKQIRGVNHVFVSSGLRFDLALQKQQETQWILLNATSGKLKIAPEHTDNQVLTLMRKPNQDCFKLFFHWFKQIKNKYGLKVSLGLYLILSHPGSDLDKTKQMKDFLDKNRLYQLHLQDFTPSPQTLSTAMYVSQQDWDQKTIVVPNPSSKDNPQRQIMEPLLNKGNQSLKTNKAKIKNKADGYLF